MAPPYTPRLLFSSWSMIWHALNFGAPERVPAGRIASTASLSSRIVPVTVDPMCITWENRSISMYFSTFTVPIRLILPISFRPRSTSMLCSASSFSSCKRSSSRALSSSGVLPRGRVPASGNVLSLPLSSFASVSGDAPESSMSSLEK